MSVAPVFERVVGETTPEILASNLEEYTAVLAAVLNGSLEFSVIDEGGSKIRGNIRSDMVEAFFPKANTDTFVSHTLGFPARFWWPVSRPGRSSSQHGRP